jgi:hypothetical protein
MKNLFRLLTTVCALMLNAAGLRAQSYNVKFIPNDSTTGTTQFTLTKINSSGNAVIMATTDTNGYTGVCVANCGKVGTATIQYAGSVPLIMSNASTALHYVQVSGATGGDGLDSGATTFPASGGDVIGRVQVGAAAAAAAMVDLALEIPPSGTQLTAHSVSTPAACVAASASGTAYACTTSPTFTPAANDAIYFKADVANTGAATLSVNSSSAAGVKKQGGGTALIANDLLAAQWSLLIFDGTNWQMQGQTGNVASGGCTSNSYYSGGSFGESAAVTNGGANQISWTQFQLPCGGTFGHIMTRVTTADGTNNSDLGIYNSAGTLVAHIGPATYASTGPQDLASSKCLPNSVTASPVMLRPHQRRRHLGAWL